MIKKATFQEVSSRLRDGDVCQVVDVREYSEFDHEHIDGARLVPMSVFDKHIDEIDAAKPTYLMCRTGNRAGQAAEKLSARGFTDVYVVEGGMVAWAAAGLPVIRGESKVWSLERQVRFTAGTIVVVGVALGFALSPYLFLISALIGAGLMFSAATDTCAMGMMLARMPWNKAAAN